MIAVIELAHHSFAHECFNAGTLLQVAKAHPEEVIIYYAEEEQTKCVGKLLSGINNISYHVIEDLDLIRRNNNLKVDMKEKIFSSILDNIFKNNQITTALFTSSHCFEGLDASRWVEKFPNIHFLFFQHGEVEQLLNIKLIKIYKLYRESLYYMAIYIYLSLKDYIHQIKTLKNRKKGVIQYRQYLEKLGMYDNASIILFSTEYLKYKDVISGNLISQFKKIYLPYVYDWDLKHRPFDGEVKIGILPKTAEAPDAVVWKVVDYVNQHIDRVKKPFKFYMYREQDRGIKNVYTYESKGYDRKYINEFFEDCDWLLIPYPKNKYVLSSSGSMFDCINMELPIMMYESPCFNGFEDIGIRGKTVTELGELVIDTINTYDEECKSKYIKKMRSLKVKMEQDNVEFFRNEF